uniref:Bromodomain containing protein n=1 Tax=Babesia bovis TaxID=5865 RepID=S6B3J7_BABBO|nr:bromodomain containing protein [Babesia bovis]
MRMQKVGFPEQLQRIHAFAGILEATRCCIALCERLIEKDLVSHAWESFGNVVEELSQSHPVLFINMDCDNSVVIRDLLYEQMRPRAASNRYYNVQIFIHIRSIINLLFGPGRLSESDPAPDQSLVTQHIESVTSGLSMPKIATFRRMYGDGARSGSTNWIEVAVEAIGALMELPQARWFIYNPELSLVGYRSMVKHPMWFSKIEEKARGGQYTMPMQFKADIALVFKNARIVNKADSLPYADSIFVEGQFDTLWPAIVRTFQRNAKGPVPK